MLTLTMTLTMTLTLAHTLTLTVTLTLTLALTLTLGTTVQVVENQWSAYSTCAQGLSVLGVATLKLLDREKNNIHVKDVEVTDKGARAWCWNSGCVIQARCGFVPGMSIKNGGMISHQAGKAWSQLAACPSGYTAIGLARLKIDGGDNNQDHVNDVVCGHQGCRAWCWTQGTCSVQARCAKGVIVTMGSQVLGAANAWGPLSTCPEATTAVGIAQIDVYEWEKHVDPNNVRVNEFQCTNEGCRAWCFGARCKLATRCVFVGE